MLTRLHRSRLGAGKSEYIIVVFLIAIGTIGVTSLFGDNIRALFATTDNSLAGVDGIPETKEAGCVRWTLKGGDLLATGSCQGEPSESDPAGGSYSSNGSALNEGPGSDGDFGGQNGLGNLASNMASGKFWTSAAVGLGGSGVDLVVDTAGLAWGLAKGTFNAVTDPVGTGRTIADAVTNPGATAGKVKDLGVGIWNGGKEGLKNWYGALTSEDPEQAGKAFGKGAFEVAGVMLPVTKAKWLGKAGKAGKTGRNTSKGMAAAGTVRNAKNTVSWKISGKSLDDVVKDNGGIRPKSMPINREKIPLNKLVAGQPEVKYSNIEKYMDVNPKEFEITVVPVTKTTTIETATGTKEVVEEMYAVIDGHHRWAAAGINGAHTITARVQTRAVYEALNFGDHTILRHINEDLKLVREWTPRRGVMPGAPGQAVP